MAFWVGLSFTQGKFLKMLYDLCLQLGPKWIESIFIMNYCCFYGIVLLHWFTFFFFFRPPHMCGSVLTKRELFYRVCMCLRMSLNARCGIVRKIGKTHLDEKGKPRCGLPSETGGKKELVSRCTMWKDNHTKTHTHTRGIYECMCVLNTAEPVSL